MKKIIAFIIVLMITINGINGQSLTVSYSRIFSKTTAVVPIVNYGKGPDITENSFRFSYEHYMKNRLYSIVASYTKFDGCTVIYFEPGGWDGGGEGSLGRGFCNGVKIHRFDLALSYLLTEKNKNIYLKPFIAAGLQISRKTGIEFWRDGLPINGPNYFELEPMDAIPMNTAQVVPSVGLHTGFVFWKRLDIGIGLQGVYAFKPYQKMYLKYQYKGVVQPMAEYESTGTGLFVTFGVGYRFAKLIK